MLCPPRLVWQSVGTASEDTSQAQQTHSAGACHHPLFSRLSFRGHPPLWALGFVFMKEGVLHLLFAAKAHACTGGRSYLSSKFSLFPLQGWVGGRVKKVLTLAHQTDNHSKEICLFSEYQQGVVAICVCSSFPSRPTER